MECSTDRNPRLCEQSIFQCLQVNYYPQIFIISVLHKNGLTACVQIFRTPTFSNYLNYDYNSVVLRME